MVLSSIMLNAREEQQKMRISRRSVLCSIAALGILAGPMRAAAQDAAWPTPPAAGEKGSPENPIKLGSNWTVGFLPAYSIGEIAKAHGWNIEVIDFASSSQRATALAQGSLDAAMLGWAASIKLAADGFPAVVIANSFSNGYAIIAGKDTGIKSVEDLKGKTVAITIGSMNEIHLLSQLERAAIAKEYVDIVQMNLSDMSLALARGDIDVMVSDEPASSVALTSGFGVLVKHPNDTDMGGINANVTTTRDFIENSEPAVQALVTAFVEATDHLKANPDTVLEQAKEIFKRDEDVVKLALQNISMDYQINPTQVRALIDWQMKLNQIKSEPDISTLITTQYLEAASE